MGEVKKQQVLGTNEVNSVIRKLKNRELEVREIPDELALNKTVLKVERQLGLRKVCQRGFDVIKQKFFVQEFIEQYYNPEIISMFETFEEYYDFLDGNIYENACYYQYDFNDEFLKSLNCIGNKNKPPAMQVCSQTALASSKKPPCYNEYKVRQPNHYNKEESKWTIIVYHTQNGHANII